MTRDCCVPRSFSKCCVAHRRRLAMKKLRLSASLGIFYCLLIWIHSVVVTCFATIAQPLWRRRRAARRLGAQWFTFPDIEQTSFSNFGLKTHVHTAKIWRNKNWYWKSYFMNDFWVIFTFRVYRNSNFRPFSAFFALFSNLNVGENKFWVLECIDT